MADNLNEPFSQNFAVLLDFLNGNEKMHLAGAKLIGASDE
jgi:hypothetical protein